MYICTHARSCFIFKYRVFGKKCSNYSFDAISFSLAEVVRNDNLKQETTENFQPWRETKKLGVQPHVKKARETRILNVLVSGIVVRKIVIFK